MEVLEVGQNIALRWTHETKKIYITIKTETEDKGNKTLHKKLKH